MKSFLKCAALAVAAGGLAIGCWGLLAREQNASETHAIVNATELKWTPIISGWEITVVSGNPDREGEPFTVRFRGQDGAKVPPHWHPIDENVTVLKGTFLVGVGEKYEELQLKAMTVGSFMTMPKEMRHFARAEGETIIQAHGVGPFKVNWVNPAEVGPQSDPKK
jgi:quercetin dioxygenase-like cupin family protein